MSDSHSVNRREYYRIEDQVGLEFRTMTRRQDIQDLFEDRATQGLHQELSRIDQDVRQQLAALADRDRNLAFLLKALNHKLDTVARIMTFEQKPLQQGEWHQVTLSEGGIAFASHGYRPEPGARLGLRLTLMPELQRVLVQGEIVKVEDDDAEQPRVHVTFTDLSDSNRQIIARHVLRVQARQRQAL